MNYKLNIKKHLNLLIDFFEHGWNDKHSLHSLDLIPTGPDVPEEDLSAFRVNGCSGLEEGSHSVNTFS